jgi:hypothetical protein
MKKSAAVLIVAMVVFAMILSVAPVGRIYTAVAFGAFGVAIMALIELTEDAVSTTYRAIRQRASV